MKKVLVKNLDGVQTHGAEMDDPTQWIADCVESGVWGDPAEYTVEIVDITAEHELDLCIKSRIAEYPDLGEFLNAFFDGGEPALAELQAKRLAVKQKYPKPVGGN